jgi:YVTN family beta-propeller protein
VTLTITDDQLGPGPSGAAITPDGNKIYVANNDPDLLVDRDTVSVIDTLTNTVIAKIRVGQDPAGVAITRGAQAD